MWLLSAVVAVNCSLAEIPAAKCDAYAQSSEAAAKVEERLGLLEAALIQLEAKSDPPLKPAHDEAQEIFDAQRDVSLSVDALGPPTLRGSQELRRRLNSSASRLASCRDRISAIQLRSNRVQTSVAAAGAQAWLVGSAPPALASAVKGAWRDPRPNVVSPRGVANEGRPGFKTARKGFVKEAARVEAIARMHEKGLSETRGDPVKRGNLVYPQNGETCAIIGAQQLLLAYGLLPLDGDRQQQEDALFAEAKAKGWFRGDRATGGTPYEHVGSLLQAHGLLIQKHHGAGDDQLADAVANGKLAMVEMDTAALYHNRSFKGATHVVVVTGLERDKKIGAVLGYYINDSNNGPYYSEGRLVPVEVFLKAWHARGSRFIEVR